MQSAPFCLLGSPEIFLLSRRGQQAVQLSRRGRHRQRGCENMETIRGEAAVWSC